MEDEKAEKKEVKTTKIILLEAAARAVADLMVGSTFTPIRIYWPRRKSVEEQKTTLVKELLEAGIDPLVFDSLLSNEIDRRLKVRFGVAFLTLTLVFTAASYAIVVLNSIYEWGISDVAITALIIETPIQFIGLLYIVARNLFPQPEENRTKSRKKSGIQDEEE
ncbi:MAG TPA: hypothetical protein VFZ40_13400 [Pyrinomonadaceae bacterium]